jgi:hypothetical protein
MYHSHSHLPNDKPSPYQWNAISKIVKFSQIFKLTSYNIIY